MCPGIDLAYVVVFQTLTRLPIARRIKEREHELCGGEVGWRDTHIYNDSLAEIMIVRNGFKVLWSATKAMTSPPFFVLTAQFGQRPARFKQKLCG